MEDKTCLAEGYVFPTDPSLSHINANEIIVGPTGCGKTLSTACPRMVYTYNNSVVVPITKKAIEDTFRRMFEERGYDVVSINFANPEMSEYGYDPLHFIHSDEDVVQMARNLITPEKTSGKFEDRYWNDSATSVLASEIALIILNAKEAGKKPSFADVIVLHRSLRVESKGSLFTTNLDVLFQEAELRYPGNQASELWKTVNGLSIKTASCILSICNSSIDKICTESVLKNLKDKKSIDFRELGRKKTALFIRTSPMNKALQPYINLMYADMFRELFEEAESRDSYRLEVPIHVVADDFATGSRINDFEEYISIFRAAGISVSLLLQSESQLSTMYGDYAATTIINNCDTYVFMGGSDYETCEHVAKRLNKPLHQVMCLPLEQVVVFRRGAKPFSGRRYQILDDPVYKEIMAKNNN